MRDEMKKAPRLRFRGFQEDWELCKVKDFLIESKIKGSNGKIAKKLTVKLWRKGIVAKEEVYEGSLATQYYVRKSGQFMYGKLDFLNQAFGIVPIELDGYESTVDSPSFDFKPLVDSVFFLEYVSLEKFYKYQGNIANGSRKAKRIHVETFFNMPLPTPSYKEQQKIGTLFKQLDDTITLHQRKLDQLKNLKNAFLQLMFVSNSPENSTVPKLRFANFTEEWELCVFFDTIENTIDFRGRTPKKLGLDWSDNGYLALSALNVKHGYIDPNIDAHYGNQELYDKWMSGKELRKGQVLFTTEAPMGNVAQIPDNTGYILSQRTIAFETKKNRITDDFLAVLLGSPKIFNELSSLSSGGTAKGISQKSLSQLRVQIPCSISEQKEIGIFFKQLNETITLHQNKLDQLKELKKSYLQNMFI